VTNKADENSSTLLREIEALGGSQEDLDLVGGLLSGSEDEALSANSPTKTTEGDLQHDLADFVKGLGIRKENKVETSFDKRKPSSKGPNTQKDNTGGILPGKKKSITSDSVAEKDKFEPKKSPGNLVQPSYSIYFCDLADILV